MYRTPKEIFLVLKSQRNGEKGTQSKRDFHCILTSREGQDWNWESPEDDRIRSDQRCAEPETGR